MISFLNLPNKPIVNLGLKKVKIILESLIWGGECGYEMRNHHHLTND